MKYKTLLLLTILAIGIVTFFTACPEPEETSTAGDKKTVVSSGGEKKSTGDSPALPKTKHWYVSTLADSGFKRPYGIAVAKDGESLYVADRKNNSIKNITLPSGKVSTLADSGFNKPSGIAVAKDGESLYVADTFNNSIKKIDLKDNAVSTFASGFKRPYGITITPDGTLYVVDTGNHSIKKITIDEDGNATVSIIAKNGKENTIDDKGITIAKFNYPYGIAAASDTILYVTDAVDNNIKKLEYKEAEET